MTERLAPSGVGDERGGLRRVRMALQFWGMCIGSAAFAYFLALLFGFGMSTIDWVGYLANFVGSDIVNTVIQLIGYGIFAGVLGAFAGGSYTSVGLGARRVEEPLMVVGGAVAFVSMYGLPWILDLVFPDLGKQLTGTPGVFALITVALVGGTLVAIAIAAASRVIGVRLNPTGRA